jgi:putative flippase GtrA
MTTPVLDVVIPVHNEQHTVAASVRRLHHHLVQTFPYPFRITVADNASTDATAAVASGLAAELDGVALVRLGQKGRGRALKQVWLASDAPILAYMDVDLSTDLDALWPLVAPLMSGHSDVAIGSRLAQGARVVRGTKREVISRCYNLVLRATLGARFTDAQCGFKAIRSDVAAELLPLVEDTTWFFDTELLVLAQRSGLRIHEVPVDWFDDPDSRVDVVGTALDDLRGVVRVRRSLASGRLPVAAIEARIGRHPPGSRGDGAGAWQQLTRFAAVGAASTVLHLGLFAALAPTLGSTQAANLVALVLATVANTAMNRRWTFRVHGAGAVRHQLQGLSIFALTWLLTAGALGLLHTVVSNPGTALATMVVAMATAASTGLRFVAMRSWMFRSEARFSESPSGEPQYSVTMNVPSSSSNTTTPVQSQPSTEPWHTVTSP